MPAARTAADAIQPDRPEQRHRAGAGRQEPGHPPRAVEVLVERAAERPARVGEHAPQRAPAVLVDARAHGEEAPHRRAGAVGAHHQVVRAVARAAGVDQHAVVAASTTSAPGQDPHAGLAPRRRAARRTARRGARRARAQPAIGEVHEALARRPSSRPPGRSAPRPRSTSSSTPSRASTAHPGRLQQQPGADRARAAAPARAPPRRARAREQRGRGQPRGPGPDDPDPLRSLHALANLTYAFMRTVGGPTEVA